MRAAIYASVILPFACCHIMQAKDTPNIIIFLADDLGYGDVIWNNPAAYPQTPNLNELAQDGCILTNCYSSSPMSSPSRAGLLTGRVPLRLGIHDWIKEIYKKPYSNIYLSPTEITFAEMLKQAGYQTAFLGKWHLNNDFNTGNQSDPNDQGFDYWFGTATMAEPTHCNPTNFFENGVSVGLLGTEERPTYSANIVSQKTVEWLMQIDNSKPFLAYVAFHEPHVVCDAPQDIKQKYLDKIKRGEIPLLENTGPEGLGQAEYYACIENMDNAVGNIIRYLEETNQLDNTIILFSSDNGPDTNRLYQGRLQSVGETTPLIGRKRTLFEGGIHQATFVYWKKHIPGGTKNHTLIGHVDFLPTIAELTNTTPPDCTLDGENILPSFQDSTWKRKKPLHWHFYAPSEDSPQSVMRYADYVITANWTESFPLTRFDLKYIKQIKNAHLKDFKLYKYIDGSRHLLTGHRRLFKQMKKQLMFIHSEACKECPNDSIFMWNDDLQQIVNSRYADVKD